MACKLVKQGFEQGKCRVFDFSVGASRPACEVTLRRDVRGNSAVDLRVLPFTTRALPLGLPIGL